MSWLLTRPVAWCHCHLSWLQIFWASYLSAMASKKGGSSSDEQQRLEPAYLAQKEL
jgi:hypothetical protein